MNPAFPPTAKGSQMTLDLTKPIRLKGSREVRQYGGQIGDGHVIFNADGSFANTTPISMESIESEYENAPEAAAPKSEEKPQSAEYLIAETPIGKCCGDGPSRFSLSQVMAVPGDDGVYLFAADRHALSVIAVDGRVNSRRYVPGSMLCEKPGVKNRVTRRAGRWESQYESKGESEIQDPKFPNINKLLRSVEGRKSITLDALFLLRIAKALGGDTGCTTSVTILIDPITPLQSNGIACVGRHGIGVLMPRACVNCDSSAADAKRFDVQAKRFCSALAEQPQ